MCFCSIIPTSMLKALALNPSTPAAAKQAAINSLAISGKHRERRELAARYCQNAPASNGETRFVYNAGHMERLPGAMSRKEGQAPVADEDVNTAYDDAGTVYDFYKQAFKRDSIDDRGMQLVSTVNYGQQYANAFWEGQMMVYGDGDGYAFNSFVKCLDISAHEITHGVTQHSSNLIYRGQSGALNESFSDCMGACVKQFKLKQTADKADWLIGAGLFTNQIKGKALRSMIAPGTAYNDRKLGGKDPQPDHMDRYIRTFEDNEGVHLNSGIPNKAFALACGIQGGYSWERIGAVWYEANNSAPARCNFAQWAMLCVHHAQRFGPACVNIIRMAFNDVGITV